MEVGAIPHAFSCILCFVLNLRPPNFSGADGPEVKSPHGLWLFALCQALSVSVKNAFPALRGVLCALCWRFCKSYQGWEALREHPGLDCIIWVQPSSFAALMFDKCIALYHQTLLWFCAKIFHSCSPLSLIDNALRAFYLLQRPWLT